MKIHELKIDAKFAKAKKEGRKNFEIRNNDRDFRMDDLVKYTVTNNENLDEWFKDKYFRITHITDFEQKEGYVVFGDELLKEVELGDEAFMLSPEVIDVSKHQKALDELEYACWDLFKDYCALFGLEFHPEKYEGDPSFDIAKRIQDTIIDVFMECEDIVVKL